MKIAKQPRFSRIAYNSLLTIAPVYTIQGDVDTGLFDIWRYVGGDPAPDPPIVHKSLEQTTLGWTGLDSLAHWEADLRKES